MKLTEDMKKRPRDILKAWKIILGMLEERNIPALAICDLTINRSENFLLHFGFIPHQNGMWIRRT